MTFYILRCKSCGKYGVKEIRTIKTGRFRCAYCLQTFGVKHSSTWGLALQHKGPYDSALKAAADCAALNAEGGKQ
jgi:transposase-like protein